MLGEGLVRYEKVNLSLGEKDLLLDTDEFVKLVETQQKLIRNNEQHDEILLRAIVEGLKEATFGRFFVYLLILLSRMRLNAPDLGQYIDHDLPPTVIKES